MQETTSSLAIVEPSASKQSALLRVDEPNLNSECPEDCTQTGGFSIKHLPFELRCLIYADYLATNPSIPITSLNAALPLHQTHSIYSSSPYFQGAEVPSSFYHAHQTFTFTSGITMRQFSELFDRQREVKRIRIILNSPQDKESQESQRRDWLWLIQECFKNVADISLVLLHEQDRRIPHPTKGWWSCVEDAFREGMAYRNVEWLFPSGDTFRKRFPRLSLVDGQGKMLCWSEYRGEGLKNDTYCLL